MLNVRGVTGLIYLAIVGLWAAVLVPMWLRRHDDEIGRRFERHQAAMGALAGDEEREAAIRASAIKRRRIIILTALSALAFASIVALALGRTGAWETVVGIAPLVAYSASLFLAGRLQAQSTARHARARSVAAREARLERAVQPPIESRTVFVVHRGEAHTPTATPAWDQVFDQSA